MLTASPLNIPNRLQDDSYLVKGIRVRDIQPNELEKGDLIIEPPVVGIGSQKARKIEVDRVDLSGCSKPGTTHVNGNLCYDGTAPVAVAV